MYSGLVTNQSPISIMGPQAKTDQLAVEAMAHGKFVDLPIEMVIAMKKNPWIDPFISSHWPFFIGDLPIDLPMVDSPEGNQFSIAKSPLSTQLFNRSSAALSRRMLRPETPMQTANTRLPPQGGRKMGVPGYPIYGWFIMENPIF